MAWEADHFLIRYSRNVGFHPDPQRSPQEQRDAQGRRMVQQWGWLGSARDPRRLYVRLITLEREGQEPVALITDLLDEATHPADDLLAVYLRRWGIENLFQQVTEVFDLRRLIGSTPKAMIFQAGLCLVIYNLIQVIRGYAAQAGKTTVRQVSSDQLFTDVQRHLVAWTQIGDVRVAIERFAVPLAPAVLCRRLGELIGSCWTTRWLKTKPQPQRPPRKYPTTKVPGGRISVTRALKEYDEQGRRRPSQR